VKIPPWQDEGDDEVLPSGCTDLSDPRVLTVETPARMPDYDKGCTVAVVAVVFGCVEGRIPIANIQRVD